MNRISQPHRQESARLRRLNSRRGVLHHKSAGRLDAKQGRGQKEHLRVRLGTADLCPIGHRVKEAVQPQAA